MKVKICNGSADTQYLARIASPKKPFSVNNTKFTVRAGRFVRLPVIFMPTEPGRSFEATLVVTADPETILSVKLQGSSSDWNVDHKLLETVKFEHPFFDSTLHSR